MRFSCVHCQHELTAEAPPARCPRCLRSAALIGVGTAADGPAPRAASTLTRRALGRGAAGLAVVGAGLAAGLWRQRARRGDGQYTPTSAEAIQKALGGLDGAAATLVALLVPDRHVEALVAQAGGAAGPAERRLTAALRALAGRPSLKGWSMGELRPAQVLSAGALARAILAGEPVAAYPLELAALGVAAARQLGLTAAVAERAGRDAPAPADPSGYLGDFAVALVGPSGGVVGFSVPGGREVDANELTPLTDSAAVAVAVSLAGLHASVFQADPDRALALTSAALGPAGRLPSVRSARALAALAAGMREQALAELEAARSLRPDAARSHNLASLRLLLDGPDAAEPLLARALELAPDLALAHLTRARLFALRGDHAGAAREEARALELAPDCATIQLARAESELANDREAALARAQRWSDAWPAFDALVRRAALERRAGSYDAMRDSAQRVLALAPRTRRDDVRALLEGLLGPAAFDGFARSDAGVDDLADLVAPPP